jgi:hypothetical protein
MNRSIVLGGVCAALTLAAATTASASCSERKETGTVLGGIGGALIGNSIAGGGGGAILGGIGGAVVGHQVAGAGCGRYRHAYYDRGPRYPGYRREGYAPQARTVYYDARGNLLPDAAPAPYAQAAYRTPVCGSQSYYDARGNLVQQPLSNCR